MSQPEQRPWYVEPLKRAGEALEDRSDITQGCGGLIVEDDSWVRFEGLLHYDQVLEGGCETRGDHFERFAEVRRRLGLEFDIDSVRGTDLGSFQRETTDSFSISIYRDKVNDREAMFFIALPLATADRPLEKVLGEIRECGRLGAGVLVALNEVETKGTLGSDLIFEKVNLERVLPYDQAQLVRMLAESQAVMSFVKDFTRYKELMAGLATSTNRTADIKELSRIEAGLEERQQLANAAMKLGKPEQKQPNDWWKGSEELVDPSEYTLDIALEITNIHDPRFVNRYQYAPYRGVSKDVPIPERQKLQLVVLHQGYSRERSDLIRTKNIRETEQAGW